MPLCVLFILSFSRLRAHGSTPSSTASEKNMFSPLTGLTSDLTRQQAIVQAQDPSEHIKQCIAFLFTVECVEVADTVKNSHGDNSFLINVFTNDTSNKSEATATNFQIQRTFKEFKTLHSVVEHWSNKHIWLDPRYGIRECLYCQPLRRDPTWPGSLSHLTTSKKKMQKQLEGRLNAYVAQARLPRSSELECQGFDHIPSIVTRFLLKDMPAPPEPAGGNRDAKIEAKAEQ